MRIQLSSRSLAMIALISGLTGCSAAHVEPSRPEPSYFPHVVAAGESLAIISAWYTGSPNQWRSLFVSAATSGARQLRVGDTVIVPSDLLVRRDSPTQEFIKGYPLSHPLRAPSRRTSVTPKGRKGSTGAVSKSEFEEPTGEGASRDGVHGEEPIDGQRSSSETTAPVPPGAEGTQDASPSSRVDSEELEQTFLEQIIAQ